MLDIKFIRQNKESVEEACRKKKIDMNIDYLLELDEKRRLHLTDIEALRAEQNKLGKEGIEQAKKIKAQIKEIEPELKKTEDEFQELMLRVPNVIMDDVPEGKDETENRVIRKWGEVPKFDFKPKDHVSLGESLDIIDTKKAAEVTGARFGYLKGGAALLELALIQHAFNVLTSKEIVKKIADSVEPSYADKVFIPVFPPVMVRPEVFVRMARLSPEDKNERYYLPQDDLYLVGSAEHTLGALHMDEIIPEKDFPIRYLGFSTSFRREAGSYGKDTRGILRVHQFDKIEMESFTTPENSLKEQNFFVAIMEYLMQSLKIPYQVVMICTGDMGAPDARQIDIEAWLPGQNKYRETHTSDLMTDYQARRLNTRVRRKDGSIEFVHMNDATAFAIGRAIIAIIENYQQKDGTIKIPEVLQKYTGIKEIK